MKPLAKIGLTTILLRSGLSQSSFAALLSFKVSGLRACYVAAMKLTDIDWINGEIKILQTKTAASVVLPLTKDVGEALSDYILNARPSSKRFHTLRRTLGTSLLV